MTDETTGATVTPEGQPPDVTAGDTGATISVGAENVTGATISSTTTQEPPEDPDAKPPEEKPPEPPEEKPPEPTPPNQEQEDAHAEALRAARAPYEDGRYDRLMKDVGTGTDLLARLGEQVVDNTLRACYGMDAAKMDDTDIQLACAFVPLPLQAHALALVHSVAKTGKPDAAALELGKLGLILARHLLVAAINGSPVSGQYLDSLAIRL